MGRILPLYEQHAASWDAEFGRLRDTFADRMQCQRGCSMCCSQMFAISLMEAEAISETVAGIPEAARERLREAAREYLERAAQMGVVDDGGGEPSVTPRTGLRLPCPALVDDACSIYGARPLICRKWGIPVYDPSKPDRLHACELNFRSGESIAAGDLVDRQRALLEQSIALEDQARARHTNAPRTFTVAEAILIDPARWRRDPDAQP